MGNVVGWRVRIGYRVGDGAAIALVLQRERVNLLHGHGRGQVWGFGGVGRVVVVPVHLALGFQ